VVVVEVNSSSSTSGGSSRRRSSTMSSSIILRRGSLGLSENNGQEDWHFIIKQVHFLQLAKSTLLLVDIVSSLMGKEALSWRVKPL
jgi:hypothetical protein